MFSCLFFVGSSHSQVIIRKWKHRKWKELTLWNLVSLSNGFMDFVDLASLEKYFTQNYTMLPHLLYAIFLTLILSSMKKKFIEVLGSPMHWHSAHTRVDTVNDPIFLWNSVWSQIIWVNSVHVDQLMMLLQGKLFLLSTSPHTWVSSSSASQCKCLGKGCKTGSSYNKSCI